MQPGRRRVCFMVGADDDIVLDPRVDLQLGKRQRKRSSRFAGKQADVAIVESIREQFPQIDGYVVREIEELRSTDAEVELCLHA